jgi:toxin ParE1/3/4
MAKPKPLQLLITPIAEQDLAEIWVYIAEDSPTAATAFIEKIQAKFIPLLEFPGMGAPRDQIVQGLRAAPYKNYVIYYMHDDAAVTIIRVVHGARDVSALF